MPHAASVVHYGAAYMHHIEERFGYLTSLGPGHCIYQVSLPFAGGVAGYGPPIILCDGQSKGVDEHSF